MELSIVIFFVALLVPGLWLIFIIGREFKQRQEFEERRHVEQERTAHIAGLRRARSRSAAPAQHPTVEPFAQASANAAAVAASMDKETAVQALSNAPGGSRLNSATLNTTKAFEQFLSATTQSPSDQFMISQVDAAFEQFLSATQHGSGPA